LEPALSEFIIDAYEYPRSCTTIGRWKVGILFEPAGGEAPGGDRFALHSAGSDALAFYLADATGHGRKGAHFWERFESMYREPWHRFASEPNEPSLELFASEVNDRLHRRQCDGEQASACQLCLAAGWISNQRELVFAGFGLGVHVVPVVASGSWSSELRGSFGFRLGWVPSKDWPRFEGAFKMHHISGVRRLCLASDAYFGDDHFDPEGALKRVEELGRVSAVLTLEETLSYMTRLPHAHDDATFVALEPIEPRP
jgi:hypothetical protein